MLLLSNLQASSTTSIASTEDSSSANESTLAKIILMSANGAFCTPRIVTRSLTSQRKPPAQSIIEEMKSLVDQSLGYYKEVSNTKVYYKPLPTDGNKELIEKHRIQITEYRDIFCNKNMKGITQAQYNRLLSMSPDEQILRGEYGYVDMK